MVDTLVKEENFVNLQGWMITRLGLKGNELIIFAIIYGFSQGDQGVYNGSLKYLADWTNSTKRGVMKNLKSLVDKKLIKKNEIIKGNIKYCEYVSEFIGGEQSSIPSEQSSPNNIVNIIDRYNSIPGEQSSTVEDEVLNESFEKFWSKYPRHIDKQRAKKTFLSITRNKKVTLDEILIGVDKYLAYIKQDKVGERYIKHPTSWLNAGGWENEYNIYSSKPQPIRREPTEEELREFRKKRQQEIAEWNERNRGR